jgi:hypothetical protein
MLRILHNKTNASSGHTSKRHIEKKGSYQVLEYADPEQGVNGFVRFTYDERQRLVGVWVSMAL